MPKKKAPRSGELLRGKTDDTNSIAKIGYNGYIPPLAIDALERETYGLVHGIARLEIHVRDGKLYRFVSGRERSHFAKGGGCNE